MRRLSIALALIGSLFALPAQAANFSAKDASAATIIFTNPGNCTTGCTPIFAWSDSTGANLVAVLTAGADGASNTATGGLTYGRNLVYNGTTWDRWTGAVTVAGVATAANQATGNTALTTINTTLGTPMQQTGGSVAPSTLAAWGIGTATQNSASAANGRLALGQFNTTPTTITSGNMSPFQLDTNGNLLVNVKAGGAGGGAVTVADSADVTQGAIADAAVVGGATGTVSAKLRAISRDILTLTTLFNANGRNTSANSSPVVPSPAPTTWHLIAASGTNATPVKTSAATLFSCQLSGIGSAPAYLKIYNKASSPTVGTDTPVKTLIIPAASTAANGAGSNISFGPGGLTLGTGFAAAVTGGMPDADTASVAAATFAINCDYE